MALFKMRKGGDESAATPRPESIEAMRRRARHRLIGAAVLVLLGVLGFPVLFDTQPRPISVDIPIEIPDRNKVKPLPAPAAVKAPAVSGPVTAPPMTASPVTAPTVAAVTPAAVPQSPMAAAPASAASRPQSKADSKLDMKPDALSDARADVKPAAKSEPKPDAKAATPDPAPGESARALALLDGKSVSAAAPSDGRYVVQVGAFADATKAREVRRKVERAGLKTYTNVAETKEGKRIRVRVGPFASRTEADKAAGKLKGLDLPAAVLTL